MSAKYLFECGIATAFLALCSFGTYARIWEYKQTTQERRNAIVREVRPYHYHTELGCSSRGFKIRIEEEGRPIKFPSENWDKTVKEGDLVDLIVRKSFPWLGAEELDGLRIDDHK